MGGRGQANNSLNKEGEMNEHLCPPTVSGVTVGSDLRVKSNSGCFHSFTQLLWL